MILTDEKGNRFEFDPVEEDLDIGRLKPLEWPQFGDEYWYVGDGGDLGLAIYKPTIQHEDRKVFGNSFRTEDEAIEAAIKIKDLLQGLK